MPAARRATRPLAALTLIAVFAFGVTVLAPAEVEAVQCFCPPANTFSASGWAKDHPSCAAAKAACQSDARGQAQSHCNSTFGSSVCSWGTITYTQPGCFTRPTGIGVDCQQTYQCERCIDF